MYIKWLASDSAAAVSSEMWFSDQTTSAAMIALILID